MAATRHPPTCQPTPVDLGPFRAELCLDHARLEWVDPELEPDLVFARLFGEAVLTTSLPSIGGATVLVYRPTTRARTWMLSLPRGMWIEVLDGMWMSHDGRHLLLRPTNPLVAENLTRKDR